MSIKLQRFFAFSFLLVGIPEVLVSMRHLRDGGIFYIIGGIGIFYVLLALVLFLYKIHKGILTSILFSIAIFNYSYMLIEVCEYFRMYSNQKMSYNATFFNKPCAEFNKISGYRWTGDSCRAVRIAHGEIVFDNYFNPNKQGYISKKSYLFKKPNSNITRYMVFGDSFTAAEYLSMPWPDRIEAIMNDLSDKRKYEFYSFAVDGGGLANWYEIFFNEVIPNYEFDGIIIASYAEDLYREFSIYDMDNSGLYFGRFSSIPKDKTDFMMNYRARMIKLYDIVDDPGIDAYIQKYVNSPYAFPPSDLYALNNIIRLFREFRNRAGKGAHLSAAPIQTVEKISNEQFKKIEEIIQWCHAHNKQILLLSIPCKEWVLRQTDPGRDKNENELRSIAKKFNALFYSGYKVFYGLSSDEIDRNWLRYDGHWNQQGSDRFAKYLAQYIQQQLQH